MDDEIPDSVNIQARWVLDAGFVPTFSNQSLVQPGPPAFGKSPGTIYIAFGHVNPPAIEGPPGARLTAEQAAGMVLPVIPVARLAMTLDHAVELRDRIDQILGEIERVKSGTVTHEPDSE